MSQAGSSWRCPREPPAPAAHPPARGGPGAAPPLPPEGRAGGLTVIWGGTEPAERKQDEATRLPKKQRDGSAQPCHGGTLGGGDTRDPQVPPVSPPPAQRVGGTGAVPGLGGFPPRRIGPGATPGASVCPPQRRGRRRRWHTRKDTRSSPAPPRRWGIPAWCRGLPEKIPPQRPAGTPGTAAESGGHGHSPHVPRPGRDSRDPPRDTPNPRGDPIPIPPASGGDARQGPLYLPGAPRCHPPRRCHPRGVPPPLPPPRPLTCHGPVLRGASGGPGGGGRCRLSARRSDTGDNSSVRGGRGLPRPTPPRLPRQGSDLEAAALASVLIVTAGGSSCTPPPQLSPLPPHRRGLSRPRTPRSLGTPGNPSVVPPPLANPPGHPLPAAAPRASRELGDPPEPGDSRDSREPRASPAPAATPGAEGGGGGPHPRRPPPPKFTHLPPTPGLRCPRALPPLTMARRRRHVRRRARDPGGSR
ncbi:proline-rich protein 2-like [Molothrus aeneus]|uniref:proline-rich protein 2-like n=1 Tax=Molothrus aeneus TaxID=84833 RepID=UPI00345B4A22